MIYTYSVMRRGAPEPYAIAYVTLAEGPTMMTNIVDCDLDGIRIGQKVKVVFKPIGRRPAGAVLRPGVIERRISIDPHIDRKPCIDHGKPAIPAHVRSMPDT